MEVGDYFLFHCFDLIQKLFNKKFSLILRRLKKGNGLRQFVCLRKIPNFFITLNEINATSWPKASFPGPAGLVLFDLNAPQTFKIFILSSVLTYYFNDFEN